jgi:hypothetical protein
MRRIMILVMIITLPSISVGQESFPGPFGLQWGMSEAALKELGFNRVQEMKGFNLLESLSVPKAWSKGDKYSAITYKGKLVKVSANSIGLSDDIYGNDGKQLYTNLQGLLTKKYGIPTNDIEYLGIKSYEDADEFYQCLEYSGCGAFMSVYKFDGGTIVIQLKGTGRGEGYLDIAYESPAFFTAKEQIEKGSLATDEDAL